MKKIHFVFYTIIFLMVASAVLGIAVEDYLKIRGQDKGQLYVSEQLVGIKEVLDSFAVLCNSKNAINNYREPYHGKRKDIEFVSKETSNSGDTIASCQYYLKELRVIAFFTIREFGGNVQIIIDGAEYSADAKEENSNISSYAINDGYRHISLDRKTLKCFSDEVLSKIGCFKPVHLQGFLCRYYHFFMVAMYFYGIIFFLSLVILLLLYRG